MIVATRDKALISLHEQAREIFDYALHASSISAAFDRLLRFENGSLIRSSKQNREPTIIPLSEFKKIYVIAVGKAALAMLDTLLARMPSKGRVRGVCCAPMLPDEPHRNIQYYAGGHPLPNRDSFRSARAALRLLERADESTFVFFLISGGGSALFEAPLDKRITLEDTIDFHRVLVGSGATITEINIVRKHFSAVKGGRLAAAASRATKLTLLLSDVPARQLDALASGPTLPDTSTVKDCLQIIDRYQMLDRFPPSVQAFFADPALPETPGKECERDSASALLPVSNQEVAAPAEIPLEGGRAQGGPRVLNELDHADVEILLSNENLVAAACERAEALGWKVVIDNTCDDWDYREAAQYLLAKLHELRKQAPRVCLLSGGEVTVRLGKNPGTGGRNQQFALACALALAGVRITDSLPVTCSLGASPGESIVILSAGSDGVDGLSAAAGAIADPTTIARAKALALDAFASYCAFDANPLFAALGDTVVTGPTNNNLRDLRILLSDAASHVELGSN
jgi:glycerate 2-kinase